MALLMSAAAALLIQSFSFDLEFTIWQALNEPDEIRPWWRILGAGILGALDQRVHWQGGGDLGWPLLTATIVTSPLVFSRRAWVLVPVVLHLAFFGFLLSWLPQVKGFLTIEWGGRLAASLLAVTIGDLACCRIWWLADKIRQFGSPK